MGTPHRVWTAGAVAAGLIAVILVAYGTVLRFSVENTDVALAKQASGEGWLIVSAALFITAAICAWQARAPRWIAVLIALPIVVGVFPALLAPRDLIPFATTAAAGLAALVALVALILAEAHRTRSPG